MSVGPHWAFCCVRTSAKQVGRCCRAQAPGYSKVISRPMDFMTMHARFEAGAYSNWDALRADLDTMFSNAMTFNAPATVYHKQARSPPGALPTEQVVMTWACIVSLPSEVCPLRGRHAKLSGKGGEVVRCCF